MKKLSADILLCNHFDLIWRRGYKKALEFEGKQFVSYTDIQEYYIDKCLKLCEEDEKFAFNIECVAVLRNYLEKHPEALSDIQRLYKQGRLDIPFAGDNIIDTNLVSGESIIRNYQVGAGYMDRIFGEYTPVCYRRDGFGNSAQLPQIMKGFDIDWIWGLSYSEPGAPLWRGLDGTVVFCEEPYFLIQGGSTDKYRPCNPCKGTGEKEGKVCPACEGRKIHWKDAKYELTLDILDMSPPRDGDYGVVGQRSEELIPPASMLLWPKQLSEYYGIKARFGTFRDIYLQYKEKKERTIKDPGSKLLPSCELNPNNTGVYVTRSLIKRECRRLENRFFSIERLLCMAVMKGMTAPKKSIDSILERILFTLFHDAITGTIVDAAYNELMDVFAEINEGINALEEEIIKYLAVKSENTYTIINTSAQESCQPVTIRLDQQDHPCRFVDEDGNPLLISEQTNEDGFTVIKLLSGLIPAFSGKTIYKVKGAPTGNNIKTGESFIENESFMVKADSSGILSIIDKRTGQSLFQDGKMRIHEIIIEHDEGSPWATLSEHRPQIMLTGKTRLVSVEKNEAVQKMTFYVEPFSTNTIEGIEVQWTVSLTRGTDRIDFKSRFYWDTYNERVRIAFPTKLNGKHLYEIPYGTLERPPYDPDFQGWYCSNGDWPAINWVGTSTENGSIALLNKGIPSHRIDRSEKGDIIYLSLLRSPVLPTYLHEPRSYNMTAYGGMRDAGIHEFEYALTAYDRPLEKTAVVAQADEFNMQLVIAPGKVVLPAMPILKSDNMRISAVTADSTGALIIRLFEFRGIGGKAELQLPEGREQAQLVQLNGKVVRELVVKDRKIEFPAKPFEIFSIMLM